MKDIQGCSWKRNKGGKMREKQNQTYKKCFLSLQRRMRKSYGAGFQSLSFLDTIIESTPVESPPPPSSTQHPSKAFLFIHSTNIYFMHQALKL